MEQLKIMISLGIVMILCGCGSMKKVTHKESSRSERELQLESNLSREFTGQLEQWYREWKTEQLQTEAVVLTDSTIRIFPDKGIEIEGGQVWIRQNADKQQLRSENTEQNNQESSSEKSISRLVEETEEKQKNSDNEREGTEGRFLGIWVVVIVVGYLVYRLWRSYS